MPVQKDTCVLLLGFHTLRAFLPRLQIMGGQSWKVTKSGATPASDK